MSFTREMFPAVEPSEIPVLYMHFEWFDEEGRIFTEESPLTHVKICARVPALPASTITPYFTFLPLLAKQKLKNKQRKFKTEKNELYKNLHFFKKQKRHVSIETFAC